MEKLEAGCCQRQCIDEDAEIVRVLQDNVRVNPVTRSVEFYDDYGVKLVLRNLDKRDLDIFSRKFRTY